MIRQARESNGDLTARPLGAFQKLALWLLRDGRGPARLLDSFEVWRPAMLELGRTRSGLDSFAVLITYMYRVIDPMYLDELRELGSPTKEVAMTIAEYLNEEGRKKGREEGRQEGRIDTLRTLLLLKFQTLGAEDEARLQAATPEAIDRYLQRLLTADSLAAMFED